jgi:hypothetical protein
MAADDLTGRSNRAGRGVPPSTPRRGGDLVDLMRELAVLRDEQLLSEAEYQLTRRMAVTARPSSAERP